MDTLSKFRSFLKLEKLLLFQSFFFWKKGIDLDKRISNLEKKFQQQKSDLQTLKKDMNLFSKTLLNVNEHNILLETQNKALEKKISNLHEMASQSFSKILSKKINNPNSKISSSENTLTYFNGRRIVTVSLLLGVLSLGIFRAKSCH